MTEPYKTLYAVIDAAFTEFTGGTSLFASPPDPESEPTPGTPAQSCWVFPSGGPSPYQTNDRHNIADKTVAIFLRTSGAFDAGFDLAARLWYVCQRSSPTGILRVKAIQAGPMYIREHRGRHEFSMQFAALVDDAPA
jgi:hypothetical protein